jgi:hypothetical protein
MILAGGLAGIWLYAWPGHMSPDSAQQLLQARSHQYSDGHPPLMAATWTVLDWIVRGPALMLVLQSTLFIAGVYLILRRHVASPITAAVVTVAVAWFPPVLTPMTVIWKDSLMAGFLALGLALLPGKRSRWFGVLAITAAFATRHNAAVAGLPLIVFLFPVERWRGVKRVLVLIALWAAATSAAMLVTRVLTRVHETPWSYSVGLADIAGTISDAHAHYTDDEIRALLEGVPLQEHDHERLLYWTWRSHRPEMWWPAIAPGEGLFRWPYTPEENAAVSRAWRRVVLRHPLGYVSHRFHVFRYVLALGTPRSAVNTPVWPVHMDAFQVRQESTAVHDAIAGALEAIDVIPIYRPYIYFFAAFVLLWFARRAREPFALLASGIMYELTFLPFAPSAEYRYSHWMITCTVIAAAILLSRRLAPKPKEAAFAASP